MIKNTRWSPDTCGCVLEYSWDTALPENQRTHSAANIVKACSAHTGHDLITHFTKVMGENQGKNKAIKKLIEVLPELSKTDAEGNVGPDLDKIRFSFDANRKLTLHCKGVGPDKIKKSKDAKDAIEAELGLGAAEVVAE